MLLFIEALSPLPNSSILEVIYSNFRFIATTTLDSFDKVAICLFNESCNCDKVDACLSDESYNCLIISSSLHCPCTLVPSAMIGAKTMLWYQFLWPKENMQNWQKKIKILVDNIFLCFSITLFLFYINY